MTRHNVIAPPGPERSADTGRDGAMDGATPTIRVSSAGTAAAFVLLEITVPPYWDGCVRHRHAHTTEVLYMVNGTLACALDDITATASDATAVLIPPGAVHTIWNPTAAPATYLALFSPGDVVSYEDHAVGRHATEAAPRHDVTLSATADVLLAGPDQGDGAQPN